MSLSFHLLWHWFTAEGYALHHKAIDQIYRPGPEFKSWNWGQRHNSSWTSLGSLAPYEPGEMGQDTQHTSCRSTYALFLVPWLPLWKYWLKQTSWLCGHLEIVYTLMFLCLPSWLHMKNILGYVHKILHYTFNFSTVQFSRSVMSNSLRPHGLLHARLPHPSPTLRACSNSHPLSQWCHPNISSSFISFSSCL